MATQVKHRRGANAEILAGVPAISELWFNTTDNSIHMGDGVTPGGIKHINTTIGTQTYPTIDAAKGANLKVGQRVHWQGYYSQGDGGSNWGVVKSGVHTDDGGSIISIDVNTYIEANLTNKMKVIKFGGLPETDVTIPIQNILNLGLEATLGLGLTYSASSISMSVNNSSLNLNKGEIHKLPSDQPTGWLVSVEVDVEGYEIKNGRLVGDSLTHLNGDGEGVHNIYIKPNAKKGRIIDVQSDLAFGDGLYTGDYIEGTATEDLVIKRYRSDKCRRQGISLTAGKNVVITDAVISNVSDEWSPWPLPSGPCAGIDIEPNNPKSILENITIRNLTTNNCRGAGLSLSLAAWSRGLDRTAILNISVTDHKDTGSYRGCYVLLASIGESSISGGTEDARLLGKCEIIRPHYINNATTGILVAHWTNEKRGDENHCQLDIVEPTIDNWARDLPSQPEDSSAIVLLNADISGNDYGSFSGVNIYRPRALHVSLLPESSCFIYTANEVTGRVVRNCTVIDPEQSELPIRFLSASNVEFRPVRRYTSILGESSTIGYKGWMCSLVGANEASVSSITVGSAITDHTCVIINSHATVLSLVPDTGVTLRNVSGSVMSTVSLNASGAKIKLTWITPTVVLAEQFYGNVTIS